MPRSTKTKGDRRTKVSRHGTPLDDAHCVKLRYNESISSFIAKVGGNCVAHERYSDGTLYFSGTVGGEQAAQLKVTAKPGWKPEIRRSRTLSLFVKTEEGVAAPAMSVEDAVDLVRQSCLREALPVIELVRVANTHSKTSHVFVQFEGETLARSFVNKVDAMPYVHRETGKLVHVHASQLNSYYQYEPLPGNVHDPLVWYNPEYVGKRCITVMLRHRNTRKLHQIKDDSVVGALDRALKGTLHEAAELVRRVEMEKSGVFAIVQARRQVDVSALARVLERTLPGQLSRLNAVLSGVALLATRGHDDELVDRLVWRAPHADDDDAAHSLRDSASCSIPPSPESSLVATPRCSDSLGSLSPAPSLAQSPALTPLAPRHAATPTSDDSLKSSGGSLTRRSDSLGSAGTMYELEMFQYFFE